MPNIKSAKKELRKNKKRSARNAKIKNNLKFLIKKTRKAIAAKNPESASLVSQTLKALDKAAQKGVIKKNKRDRSKSKLHRALNKAFK